MSRRASLALAVAVLAGSGVLAGCNEKQSEVKRESSGDAGTPRLPGVDKNLAEAVAAVAQAGEASGPPPNGVFASAAAADKELKATDPPKFTLGNRGAGATVTFGTPSFRSGKTLGGRTEVSVRTGPQSAMPTLDLTFAMEPEKAAAAAEGAPPAAASGANVKVVVSKLAKEQPGQLPPEVEGQAAKLKGSKLHLEVAPSGPARVTSIEVAPGSDESLSIVLRASGDALSAAYLPYPTEPVGVGAFWLVTTREPFSGLDVIAYRMIKLEKILPDHVELSVNVKRYVAGGQLAMPGLPAHKLVEFGGNTAAQLSVTPGDTSKVEGLFTDTVVANITVPDGPPGRDRLALQLQMRTHVGTGPK